MNKTEGGVGFWDKEREFSLEHIKIEVSVGHPEVNTLFYLVCVGGINQELTSLPFHVIKSGKLDEQVA